MPIIFRKVRKVDEKELKEFQEISNNQFPKVMWAYGNPMLTRTPDVVDGIDGMDTAYINLATHDTKISANFLKERVKRGLGIETAMRGVQSHEVNHYVHFPRELPLQLFTQRAAFDKFGEYAPLIYGFYSDVVNNLDSLSSRRRKEDIRELYGTMVTGTENVQDLIIALYQEATKLDMGVDGSKFKDWVEKLQKTVPKGNEKWAPSELYWAHANYLTMFGNVIVDYLKQHPDQDPTQSPFGKEDSGGKAKGKGKGEGSETDEESEGGQGKGKGKIKGGSGSSWGDTGGPNDYSNDDIDKALAEIGRTQGKPEHDMTKKFIQQVKPDFKDKPTVDVGRKFAGLSTADISFNDDLISYYERVSSTYGLYIAPRPRKVDGQDSYPEQNVTFEMGDPLHKLNPWSSPWILPGITKRYKDANASRTEWGYRTPDLMVILDTSGSMPHPGSDSTAVLAAFVLGRNYHKNQANVGIMNFSADSLILPPGRDIGQFYKAACAYWGGGTVVNIERLKELYHTLALEEDNTRPSAKKKADFDFSSEDDYKKLLNGLRPEQRDRVKREVEEKSVTVRGMDRRLKEVYGKMDNVIITDGAICNMPELVEYLNEIAVQARNTIFVVKSPSDYQSWHRLAEDGTLKNTTVIEVNDPKDLVGLAMKGVVKRMAKTEDEEKFWGRKDE